MKIAFHFLFLIIFAVQIACAQAPADRPHASNTKFDKMICKTIDFSVPVMGVEELKETNEDVVIFDAREKEEFDVSHIEGAQYLGYDDFNIDRLGDLSKDTKIVVYCSIGYRSEKIGEQLQALGYSNVYNLYGSIFDWVNRGYPVVKSDGETTKKVHTYNRAWSKWVDKKKAKKVW